MFLNAIYFLHFYNSLHVLFPFQKEQKNENAFAIIVVLSVFALLLYFAVLAAILLFFVLNAAYLILVVAPQTLFAVLKVPAYVLLGYEFGLQDILFLTKFVFVFVQTAPA